MTIFLPKGIKGGSVVDPEELGDEFVRASAISQDMTQYQWTKESFSDGNNSQINLLKPGAPVAITEVSQRAYLRGTTGGAARADYLDGDVGVNPLLTTADGDPNLFHVPYNRGFVEITGSTDMSIIIASEYPELIMVAFSFQYARRAPANFFVDLAESLSITPAVQVRVTVDGSPIIGAGLENAPPNGATRGMGYKMRALRTTIVGMRMLPAGSHIIKAEAAQPPVEINQAASGDEGIGSTISFETPPDESVCICHRSLMVFRFPRGQWIGG